ncbi:MAG: hypothetical protein ABI882_07660 [Acidobacteriota bacterium]
MIFTKAMSILYALPSLTLLGRLGVLCLMVGAAAPSATLSAGQELQEQAEQIARAAELMQKARQAIGRTTAGRSLSAAARLRIFSNYISVQSPTKIVSKKKVLGGRMEVDFSFPDKFRRRISKQTLSGRGYSYTETVNGERAWRNPPPPVISSYRDSRVIDVSDIERSREKYAEDARQQIAFYTLGWLLETPPSLPAEFIYGGQVRAEDGLLEAIIVKGPNGFRPVILIDPTTFLPVSLLVAFVEAKRENVLVEVATVSRQFLRDTYARARREREARRTPAQRRELEWRFSDHRNVDGLVLPHRITTLIDGEVQEEMTVNHFRVNHQIDQKRFEGQPEVR